MKIYNKISWDKERELITFRNRFILFINEQIKPVKSSFEVCHNGIVTTKELNF